MALKQNFLRAVQKAGTGIVESTGETDGLRPADPRGMPEPLDDAAEPIKPEVPSKKLATMTSDPAVEKGKTSAAPGTPSLSRKLTTSFVIEREKYQQLKILSAMEGRRFNDYIVEAIDDLLKKMAERLPRL